MKKLLKFVFSHELISGSSYVFIGSMVGNVFSFLFNLFLARNLSTVDYGVYASLVSLTMLLGIPAQSIVTAIVRFGTEYISKNKLTKARALYIHTARFTLGIGISCFVGFVILSPVLSRFLKIDNFLLIGLGGIMVGIGYISIVNTAFLQSLLRFGYLSILSSLGNAIKLVLGVLLVLLGFKVFGVFTAIILATLIPYLLGFIPLKKILESKEDVSLSLRPIFSYAIPVGIAIVAASSFTYMDVVLVKHFFTPHVAGLYAGLSLIGKVIFYFTLPVPSVMFPILVKNFHTGKKTNTVFHISLLLVLIPALCITVVYFVQPSIVIKLFLGGGQYLSIANLLGFEGIYLSLFSVLNILINFFLSIHRTKIAIPLAIGSVAQIIGISVFHNSLFEILAVSNVIVLVLIIMLLLYYLHEKTSIIS